MRLILLCLLLGGLSPVLAEVRAFPAPPAEPRSPDFTVQADRTGVPVYVAKVAGMTPEQRLRMGARLDSQYPGIAQAAFASFDVKGAARLVVTCPRAVQSAQIVPSSGGIRPVVSGNQVSFTVPGPGQWVLEVDGDWVRSLQVFANPWEADAPDPRDPRVLYYGPGIHEVSDVRVSSGQTVYLADGAVVYGRMGLNAPAVFTLEGHDITVRGRGILDGSLCPRLSRSLVRAAGRNIRVEGIVLRDSSGWTLPVFRSDNVSIRNVKIIGYRDNSDGIDLCNSRNVEVSGCYLRTYDDLVVVKTPDKGGGESRDIEVRRCVLWNEAAHALSVGPELRAGVENVRFADCDVIRDKGREWALRVYHCDAAWVRHVVFDDIRIEEAQRLFSLWIGQAMWSRDGDRGHVEDVAFRDIQAAAPERTGPVADLAGFDAAHAVQGVRFDGVSVGGRPLQAGDVNRNAFVGGVEVTP